MGASASTEGKRKSGSKKRPRHFLRPFRLRVSPRPRNVVWGSSKLISAHPFTDCPRCRRFALSVGSTCRPSIRARIRSRTTRSLSLVCRLIDVTNLTRCRSSFGGLPGDWPPVRRCGRLLIYLTLGPGFHCLDSFLNNRHRLLLEMLQQQGRRFSTLHLHGLLAACGEGLHRFQHLRELPFLRPWIELEICTARDLREPFQFARGCGIVALLDEANLRPFST